MNDLPATEKFFDMLLTSERDLREAPVSNLAGLLFLPLAHRDETSEVILSHDGPTLVRVSLERLRFLAAGLFDEFRRKGIRPGSTVLLAAVPGGNELFVALLFTALAAFGARTLLPMFMETGALGDWLDASGASAVIVPGSDIAALDHHDRERSIVKAIQAAAGERGLACYDSLRDFGLRDRLYGDIPNGDGGFDPAAAEAIASTTPDTPALLITTSGSSGRSKLVAYSQGAFIRSCLSWQAAGFYDPGKLGGRGFTPLLTHTMGLRAYFNALWTGNPVCLINTEWFEEKPETVRYFLLRMKPEHITGGPAVYQLLLELMRNFPELKDELKPHLKALVLSGTPANGTTAAAVGSAFGLRLHNAFGTTETQQVLSTLLIDDPGADDLRSLGRPLPGVTAGLKRTPEDPGCYRLFIHSPFGSASVDGGAQDGGAPEGFFDTGDIVRLGDEGRLLYEGRETRDFLKDGFGVKVPLAPMTRSYAPVYGRANHIEYFPVRSSPGLAALIFADFDAAPAGVVTDKGRLRDFGRLIAEINARLFDELEPFEFRHRVIRRFALVNGPAPRTGKGTVSRYGIETGFRDVLQVLTDPHASGEGVESAEDGPRASEAFTRCLNPYVGDMLANLGLDHAFHRAEKDSLFTVEDGREVEVLDLVGGYGVNLFGHDAPELRAAALSFLRGGGVPLADQASVQKHAGRLARELAARIGEATGKDYVVALGSSGSECVEMALHHAVLEWRKRAERMEEEDLQRFGGEANDRLRGVWLENRKVLRGAPLRVITLKDAFHGNTSGPRPLLGNDELRDPFSNIAGLRRAALDDRAPGWRAALDGLLAEATVGIRRPVPGEGGPRFADFEVGTVVAAIVEPVVGEGGVRVVDREFLAALARREFPLIMDEVQCGLGRTGTFLASEGTRADYYVFGKALGGGVEKIAALAVDRERFQRDFGKTNISTFANGGLAAAVALEALTLIRRDGIPERARLQGERLFERLEAVHGRYPSVIAEVTGRGLMCGVRFSDFSDRDNVLLRVASGRKIAGYLYASYLYRRHRVRVLPTLSAPNTLRLEPSAYITDEEIDLAAEAFEDLARTLAEGRMYDLFKPLMDGDPCDDHKGREARPGLIPGRVEEPAPGAVKVAFVAHFSRPADELRIMERDFSRASDTGLRVLFNRLQTVLEMKPVLLYAKNLFGGRIHFSFIALPLDSAELERLHRLGKVRSVVARVQEAVDMAARDGAAVVGLGGYASILSRNGLALVEPPGTRIVTGNTLTAASGITRLAEEIRKRRGAGKKLTLGAIGASGNIGAIITERLLRADGIFERVVLMDRKKEKLEAFAAGLDRGDFSGDLETSTDLRPLKRCDIISVSTNTNDPIVFPHHLKDREPVLISDVSIPSALAAAVAGLPNVTTLPFASYVTLPEDPDFVISSHTPRGAVFCCAAEAMLCGLETLDVPLKGRITPEAIDRVTDLARKHGLFGRLGSVESFQPARS
jgi:acetylornithine/succinyldiaminopimelate/putrescine aminotransferase/predicted amino acid dehydrogenase/acyl-coenzyme A synthetase/AMP-(fatty) acid ligase